MNKRLNPLFRSRLAAFTCTALCLLFSILSQAQQSLQVLHKHVRPAVSGGAAKLVSPMPAEQHLSLSILLPLRNQAALITLLGNLYDPSSPQYRQFLSEEQSTEQFSPTSADYQAVVDFAKANGFTVTRTHANRLLVQIDGSIAQINKTFNVIMNVYQHPTEDRTFYSPDREPSLNLSVPIIHIDGLNNYSIPRHNATGSGPGGEFLSSDMRVAYYGGTALTGSGQAVGVFEWSGYNLSDVDLNFSSVGQSYSVPIVNVIATPGTSPTPAPGSGDGEQVLDIVQPIGMAPGLSQERVYIGHSTDIFAAMLDDQAIVKQMTCSYSWEPDDTSTLDPIFENFALHGQTLFVASGDSGAYLQDSIVYPADDIYVTAVGGTQLVTNGPAGSWKSETAWPGSSGGPSPNGIPIPSWQVGIATYSNGASTTLRNLPDVAMDGTDNNYDCTMGVCYGGSGGTSYAAPRWAGFMALVNQQAVEAGTVPRGGVGYINPLIYAIGQGSNYSNDFHDITSGSNNCCGHLVGTYYNTVTGYDMVTGWGTPNGQALIDALAGPAANGFTLTASPSSVSVTSGNSVSTTINVNDLGGFTGSVNLATSNLPAGVTAAFNPNPTTGSSTLMLFASNSAVTGIYYLTVTGTSGSLSATITVALTVNPQQSFVLGLSPSSLTVAQRDSGTSKIVVSGFNGFNGNVSFAPPSGLPSGVTAPTPSSTTTTSTITFTAGSSATPGKYLVTITGTSGSINASIVLTLEIVAPGFSLKASPDTLIIRQGSTGTTAIKVTDLGGFNGRVTFSNLPDLLSDLPSGVGTQGIVPGSKANDFELTLNVGASAAPGCYKAPITGTSGSLNVTTKFTLCIEPILTLTASPNSLTIYQGAPGTPSTITPVEQGGFSSVMNLTATGLPSGVSVSFTPNPTTGASQLTLTASNTSALGDFKVTITGISGTQTATTTIALKVKQAGFILSATPDTLGVKLYFPAASTIKVIPQNGFNSPVTLSITGIPGGVTAVLSQITTSPAYEYLSALTLTLSTSARFGEYTATINGTSGDQTASATIYFNVVSPTLGASGGGGPTQTCTTYDSCGDVVSYNSQYGEPVGIVSTENFNPPLCMVGSLHTAAETICIPLNLTVDTSVTGVSSGGNKLDRMVKIDKTSALHQSLQSASVSDVTATSATVSWKTSTPTQSGVLYQAEGGSIHPTPNQAEASMAPSFKLANLKPATLYHLTVWSYTDTEEASATLTFKTPAQ